MMFKQLYLWDFPLPTSNSHSAIYREHSDHTPSTCIFVCAVTVFIWFYLDLHHVCLVKIFTYCTGHTHYLVVFSKTR